jgi:transcriptional regulator of acetoin/glycerol metabolism
MHGMIVPMKTQPPITEKELRAALTVAGSPEKAAAALGKSRRTVYRWMEHYAIERRPAWVKAA